ncbi:MAG: hypothetical protein FRX49_08750 [Trebouxia sp. A1-2]|nr:MAG: hypothetical protein FRX49_08750 [Trebouxia sp. A1-2]
MHSTISDDNLNLITGTTLTLREFDAAHSCAKRLSGPLPYVSLICHKKVKECESNLEDLLIKAGRHLQSLDFLLTASGSAGVPLGPLDRRPSAPKRCKGRVRHMHSLHNSDFRGTGGALLGQHKLTLVVGPALLAQLVGPATATHRCNIH